MNHSDVAHAWAHQTRESMNYTNHNMYFYGSTIYSYGSHFPIAQMYPDLGVILHTTRDYSNSTTKHKNHVWRAIDKTQWEVIEVHSVKDIEVGLKYRGTHETNIGKIVEEVTELINKQKRARAYSFYIRLVRDRIQTLDRYIELFRCKTVAKDMLKKKYFHLNSEQKEVLDQILNHRQDFTDEIDQIETDAKKRADEWDAKEAERLERKRQREAERNRERVEKWKRGEYHGHLWSLHGNSDLLRMRNGLVETSKGVKIEPNEAQQLWRLVEAVMESGEDRDFNHGQIKVGNHYSVNRITKHGDLRAGCHFLSGEVIKEFVEAQGWAKELVI